MEDKSIVKNAKHLKFMCILHFFLFAILSGNTVFWLQTCTSSTEFAVINCILLYTASLIMASYSPKQVGGTHLLTHSTKHSPSWEANRFSASQEIPRVLCNPKVHYLIHRRPPPFPILSHIDPVHATTSHFLKIHLNITLPSISSSSKWSLSPHVSLPKSCIYLSCPSYVLHAPPISFLSIWSPEQYWMSTDHDK